MEPRLNRGQKGTKEAHHMGLNQKERVIAQIEHQETDYTPYTIGGFEGDAAERLDTYYGSHAWRDLIDNAVRQLPIPNIGLLVDVETGRYFTDLFGSTWRVDLRPHQLVEPALKGPSLDGFELPAIDDCFDSDWEERARQQIEARNLMRRSRTERSGVERRAFLKANLNKELGKA